MIRGFFKFYALWSILLTVLPGVVMDLNIILNGLTTDAAPIGTIFSVPLLIIGLFSAIPFWMLPRMSLSKHLLRIYYAVIFVDFIFILSYIAIYVDINLFYVLGMSEVTWLYLWLVLRSGIILFWISVLVYRLFESHKS